MENHSLEIWCYRHVSYIISWEPEGHYHYSTIFRWEPEERYRCAKSTVCMVIAPFWFSTEHCRTFYINLLHYERTAVLNIFYEYFVKQELNSFIFRKINNLFMASVSRQFFFLKSMLNSARSNVLNCLIMLSRKWTFGNVYDVQCLIAVYGCDVAMLWILN